MLKVAGGGTGGGGTPGALVYQGTWNASTNTPTLASSVGTTGYYYVVSVAGSTNLNGITDWQVNDWAVFNGSVWQKIDNTDAVVSVNGQTGVVVLTAANVGATPNTTYVLAGTGISGGGQLNSNVTINLANTAVTAGTYGSSTNVAQITIDAQGRITAASNVAITGGGGGSGTVTNVATGTGLTGGPITTTGTISIANTTVTAAAYGNASTVGTFTVNAQGQLTAAANAAISIPASAINTAIPNSGLANSSVTVNGTAISLGGSGTVTATTTGTLTLGTGLTGTSFNGSTNVTTNLANTTVTAGSYGSANTVGTFTVDAQGRLTAASNSAISIAVGAVSGAVPNTRTIATSTGLTGGGDLSADRTLSVTANSTQQLVGIQNNGVAVATRQIINFAPGNNVVITVSDDSANGRANVTIGDTAAATFATSVTTPTVLMNGSTSGTVTLKVPAVAGTTNFQFPSSNGTSGYVLQTDGSGNTSWAASGGGGSSTYTISNKTAAYTVVSGDLGTIINCSGATSFTVSLTAAATLGAGFNVWIWNNTTTTAMQVTIDPNASETIDGISTLTLNRGEGTQIVCDGTNWQTGSKKTMRSYSENATAGSGRASATGGNSIALGSGAVASATNAFSGGPSSTSSGISAIAIGSSASSSAQSAIAIGSSASAGATSSAAIGLNSSASASVTNTGSGAMALGGSYASGADSFAAASTNNTSTYGAQGTSAVAIGRLSKATGSYSVALGGATSTGTTRSIAIGSINCTASGNGAIALGSDYTGVGPTASGTSSIAIGDSVSATQTLSVAIGYSSISSIYGKYAYASGNFSGQGDSQFGLLLLRAATTSNAATVLTSDAGAASALNQVILPNNAAFAFSGTIIARQQAAGGTASAAWKVEGLIRREGTAATTTLVASTVTAISNVPGWTLALSADTTNGGLAITATGAAATNIRWVATIQTSEVTYA